MHHLMFSHTRGVNMDGGIRIFVFFAGIVMLFSDQPLTWIRHDLNPELFVIVLAAIGAAVLEVWWRLCRALLAVLTRKR